VDDRTLRKLLTKCRLTLERPPSSVEAFVAMQSFVTNNANREVLCSLLAERGYLASHSEDGRTFEKRSAVG
jgi:hypothetical protein